MSALRTESWLQRVEKAGAGAFWLTQHLNRQLAGELPVDGRRSTLYSDKAKASLRCAMLPDHLVGVVSDRLAGRCGVVEAACALPLSACADAADAVWCTAVAAVSYAHAVYERAREDRAHLRAGVRS